MKAISHITKEIVRRVFLLISLFVFQSGIVANFANPIFSNQQHLILVSSSNTYDENVNSFEVESCHNGWQLLNRINSISPSKWYLHGIK